MRFLDKLPPKERDDLAKRIERANADRVSFTYPAPLDRVIHEGGVPVVTLTPAEVAQRYPRPA